MMTVAQAARAASKRATPPPSVYSDWRYTVTRKSGRKERGRWSHNLTTDTASGYTNRRDWQSKAMGAGPSAAFASATGFATASSATSLTKTGASFTTAGQGLAGQIVVAGPNSAGTGSTVYGVIVSNTATVLTIDQWYDPTSTSGAAGTTPNTSASFLIVPGQNPASWLAVTQNATTSAASDTTLTAELTTSDWVRSVATWAHTAAASTYTQQHLFTSTSTVTINKGAIFGAANTTAGGVMPFEKDEPNPPTLVSGDTLSQNETITIN